MPARQMPNRIWWSITATVVFAAMVAWVVPGAIAQQPNFVIFFPDQLRAREVGAYNNPTISSPQSTPTMDTLASSGIRFEYAVPGLPVCTPSRATLMTGKMPFSVRSDTDGNDWMVNNKILMHPDEITVAEQLHDLGYVSGYVGKWHLDDSSNYSWIPPERRQGFDWFAGFNSYGKLTQAKYYDNAGNDIQDFSKWLPDLMNEQAIDFINIYHDQPFFLIVSLGPPHAPGGESWREEHVISATVFTPDRMYLWDTLFGNATVTLPPNVPGAPDPSYPDPHPDPKRQLREYHAMCKGIDDCLGDILSTLSTHGIEDNTIIMISSDHGSQMGSHCDPTAAEATVGWEKNEIYEESIHVPLIVYDPRQLVPPAVIGDPVHLMDLMPTVVELAGGTPSATVQGRSFAPLVTGQGTYSPRDAVMVQYRGTTFAGTGYGWTRAMHARISGQKWKYAVADISGTPQGIALFDLDADPYEQTNRIGQPAYATVQGQLHSRIMTEMQQLLDPLVVPPASRIELDVNSIEVRAAKNYNPPNGSFMVTNTYVGDLNYTITGSEPWLSANPSSGIVLKDEDAIITVQYSTASLGKGDYSATISVQDPNALNSPQEVAVNLNVFIPGDLNLDDDVDQEDFGKFQACFSGTGVAFAEGCGQSDFDFDNDVDLSDFNMLQSCMSGPNQPPGC
ncbi:MAG: sulfatase-like hydrolase/transferase [Planctomycetota bacterium]|jgi:arylsulfatase A-like enzyme